MRRRVFRCVLLALLAAFCAVPAAAGTIVGQFYFQRDVCDTDIDPFCDPSFQFEYFNLINIVDESGPLAGLTFSGLIQIDGIDYEDQFIFPDPIGAFGSAITSGLPATPPFAAGGKASLVFNAGNFADYFGTLSLSNLLDEGSSSPDDDVFFADVVFTANGGVPVTETPSWLVVVIGLSALAVGRAFFV